VHVADGEISLLHLAGQPFNLRPLVAEDDRLSDSQRIVEVTKSLKFILILLNSDEILPDALQGQFVALNKNLDRTSHELISHGEDLLRQCGRNHDALQLWR